MMRRTEGPYKILCMEAAVAVLTREEVVIVDIDPDTTTMTDQIKKDLGVETEIVIEIEDRREVGVETEIVIEIEIGDRGEVGVEIVRLTE